MVTKYSENLPPEPRRVKVYSRTGPFVSNPTYCRTIASLTKSAISSPETRRKSCGISRPPLSRSRVSGSYNHPDGVAGATQAALNRNAHVYDGTLPGVRIRASAKLRVDLPSKINLPSAPAGIPRAKEPTWERMSPECAPCWVDGCARSSRTTHHSLKLSPSESQVPVLTGTALFVAPSRRVEATPRSPARPVRPTR